MKKLISVLLVLAMAFSLALPAFATGSGEPTPTPTVTAEPTPTATPAATPAATPTVSPQLEASLELTGKPAKTSYTVGEKLDLTGMRLVYTDPAGKPSALAPGMAGLSFEPALDKALTQTDVLVVITYTPEGGSPLYESFDLTVSPKATAAPTATPTPAPAPDVSGEAPYISAYAATDAAGGELTKIGRNDRFTMVLRVVDNALAAYGDVDESNVAARLNSSVFTYTGLAEVSQFSAGYSEGKPYCSYVLIFRDVLYNGGGNTFAVDISYEDTVRPVSAISQVLDICDQSEARTPGLIVRDVNYGGASIAAGQPATLTLSIFATSGTEDLNDVMVTLGLPEGITLASGTQTLYLGSMNSNGLQTATFSLLPSATFTGGVANIGVGLSAVGRTSGMSVSGSSTVSIPVTQPERFEITGVETSDTMMLGDSSYISVTFVNKGKTNINNLSASITGDNLANPGQSQFLGNIAPGTENSVDFDIMALDVGTISGQVVLSYEDDAGAAKTLTAEYSVMVEEMPVFDDPFMEDPMMGMPIEEEESGLPGWAIALIAVAVGGGAVVVVRKVLKKRKAKALAALGDEDEDL